MLCYVISVPVGNVWAAHTKIPTALNYFVFFLVCCAVWGKGNWFEGDGDFSFHRNTNGKRNRINVIIST